MALTRLNTGGVRPLRDGDGRLVIKINRVPGHEMFTASFYGWKREYLVGMGWSPQGAVENLFQLLQNPESEIEGCRFIVADPDFVLPFGWLEPEWS